MQNIKSILLLIFIIFSCNKSTTKHKPELLDISLIPTHVSTFGGSDGYIDLNVEGGRYPYEYEWSNGADTKGIRNLIAGIYSVVVTDSGDQTATDSVYITEPEYSPQYYLGETFPSTTVTRFAQSIFTQELHAPPIFTPNGDEVYWSLMNFNPTNILYENVINGGWTSLRLPHLVIRQVVMDPLFHLMEVNCFTYRHIMHNITKIYGL